jgi:hypothetical protein
MLTVFNLASTSPHFHHPFCLQACPFSLTSLSGASFSVSSSASGSPCSFLFHFTFPQKMAFPTCSNPLGVRSPFIGSARLHTTQSLCVRITRSHSPRPSSPRPSHKKTVCPCSLPQNLVLRLPALEKKGAAVTADSPCSCTAESMDCRARSTLHVGDRYPVASSRSWNSTSARMSVPRSLFFSLPCLKWLYVLLIVQLLSTCVHVVNPWYVKILEAAVSFHMIKCSTTRKYPLPDLCLGIFSSRKKSLPTCAAMSTSGTTLGPAQSVMLTVAPTPFLGVRHALRHDASYCLYSWMVA